MSAVTPPPAGQPPAPLSYPATTGRVGHRLHTGAVIAVITVIALIAAVVTAVVVFTRGPATSPPPATFPGGSGAAKTRPAAFTPDMARPHPPADYTTVPAGPASLPATVTIRPANVSFPLAAPIAIGNGIAITLAPGWTIYSQKADYLHLLNADKTADMQVSVGKAPATDVAQELNNDINVASTGSSAIYQNVTLGPVNTFALQSANFQQEAAVAFTADQSTQQGTVHEVGVFREWLNPSTGLSAFITLETESNDALQAAVNDYQTMNSSML
jgi:hypothetical protein